MSNAKPVPCPLCLSPQTRHFIEVDSRHYHRCLRCECTFLEPSQRLPLNEERQHYQTHDNQVDDPQYRRFLAKLVDPMLARLAPGSSGLDFGCGPGPALAAMFNEAGHSVALYDPAFFGHPAVLQQQYDFITCTEVIEHLYQPAAILTMLAAMLRPGAWLGLMSIFQTDDQRFATWRYRRDPTHVVFYRETSLRHVAATLQLSVEFPCANVAIMHKASAEQ